MVAPTAPTRVSLVLPSPLHPLPLNEPAPVEAAPRVRKPHSYWNELRNVETELVAANVALVSLASVSFLVYFCLLWCAGVPLTFFLLCSGCCRHRCCFRRCLRWIYNHGQLCGLSSRCCCICRVVLSPAVVMVLCLMSGRCV